MTRDRLRRFDPPDVFDTVALTGVVALFIAHALCFNFLIDDAYITFRYADNLAAGHGLVYNLFGERVEGYSNLLWALLLAVGTKLGVGPEISSRVLGLVAGVVVLVLVHHLGRSLLGNDHTARWLSFIPLIYLTTNRSFAAWATGGLETRFHTLIVLMALWLLDRDARRDTPPWASLVMVAMLLLVRVDGFVQVVFVAIGWLVWTRGRMDRHWRSILAVSVVALAALTVFRLAYYGEPVPNTVHAKVDGPSLSSGIDFMGWATQDYGFFLLLPLVLAAWRSRQSGPFVSMALCVLFGQLAYVAFVGGDHFEYRLLDPVWPLFGILAIVGGRRAFEALGNAVPRFAVGSLLLLALVWNGLPALGGFEDREQTTSVETEALLCAVWAQIGDWFGKHAGPGEVIALRPAGAIPYRSDLPAFDMLGLNDKVVARREPEPEQNIPGHRKLATWEDVLIRGRAVYLLGEPDFRPEANDREVEPPRVLEVAGRRFALFPTWANVGEFWLRFYVVSEEAVTSAAVDPARVRARIHPAWVAAAGQSDTRKRKDG